jgi:hypothetical protein
MAFRGSGRVWKEPLRHLGLTNSRKDAEVTVGTISSVLRQCASVGTICAHHRGATAARLPLSPTSSPIQPRLGRWHRPTSSWRGSCAETDIPAQSLRCRSPPGMSALPIARCRSEPRSKAGPRSAIGRAQTSSQRHAWGGCARKQLKPQLRRHFARMAMIVSRTSPGSCSRV